MTKTQIDQKIHQLQVQNPFMLDYQQALSEWIFETFTVKKPLCSTQSTDSQVLEHVKNSVNNFKRASSQGFDYDELCTLAKEFPLMDRSVFFGSFKTTDLPTIYTPQDVFDAVRNSLNI